MIDRASLLKTLKDYRNNMTEFEVEEMDYLIELVEFDLEVNKFDEA